MVHHGVVSDPLCCCLARPRFLAWACEPGAIFTLCVGLHDSERGGPRYTSLCARLHRMGKGAIVVSLRSKGLGSLNRVTLFDFKFHAVAIVTEVHAWYLQTWLSWSAVPIVHRRMRPGSHGMPHYAGRRSCYKLHPYILPFVLGFLAFSYHHHCDRIRRPQQVKQKT